MASAVAIHTEFRIVGPVTLLPRSRLSWFGATCLTSAQKRNIMCRCGRGRGTRLHAEVLLLFKFVTIAETTNEIEYKVG